MTINHLQSAKGILPVSHEMTARVKLIETIYIWLVQFLMSRLKLSHAERGGRLQAKMKLIRWSQCGSATQTLRLILLPASPP